MPMVADRVTATAIAIAIATATAIAIAIATRSTLPPLKYTPAVLL